jgi:putative SOS response-associated peptidase YedK
MAAIGSTPFERGDDTEEFLIVTSAADKGLVDIRDQCPLVMSPEAAREWMRQDAGGRGSRDSSRRFCAWEKFIRHAIIRAVGNVKNQGGNLIEPIDIQSNTI